MALNAFIGTWEIVGYNYINGTSSDNHSLEGVQFHLDENGDVIWTVSDELKSVPLFNCETYELYSTTVLGVTIRFGAYAGHVLEFRSAQFEPKDNLMLTCDGWCRLYCNRIYEEKMDKSSLAPFSLLSALEEGYFSDITIISSNKKEFNLHSIILKLQGFDFDTDSNPFNDLSEDVLGTILHFLYAECLPENLNEATARQVINIAKQHPSLTKLVNLCKLYIKNMALKQQIIGLVNDMHTCLNQVIEHFNIKNNHLSSPSDNLASNPSKLCFAVKQCVRDISVAGVKLLLLCDIFTKRKSELSREERHEIIRYAKSRLPIFLTQLQRFLHALKNTFSVMSASQRVEVATFLVPEIEIILETISSLIAHAELALQQIIQVLSPYDNTKQKNESNETLGKSLKNVLHIKEISKLRTIREHISVSLGLLLHKRDNFNEMTSAQKVRSIARNLEQLSEELPIFLLRLDEVTSAFDEKLEWKEFKFCFKVGTSKISGILNKLVFHRSMLDKVMLELCELVQREAFNQSLQILGLLDVNSSDQHISEYQKMSRSSSYSTPKHHYAYNLNLVESLCIPPTSNNSLLGIAALNLLNNSTYSDMEFEIITTGNNTELNDSNEENLLTNNESCIIKAHRVIVASRCDWFRRALLSGMREAIDKKIIIHDTNPLLFRIFLEYLYSGRLKSDSLSTEQIVELLLLSDRYEVDILKQMCENSLQSSIDHDSVLYFLSMADQYNAEILKKACLNFISQHHELTESEIFFELPITLQAEIFDCIWTQPTNLPKKSMTMEQLLPTLNTPTTPTGSSTLDQQKVVQQATNNHQPSNSSSLEDLPITQDTVRLDNCLTQLRDIIGDSAPREQLVQIILAADYDLCRAINYYYAKNNENE